MASTTYDNGEDRPGPGPRATTFGAHTQTLTLLVTIMPIVKDVLRALRHNALLYLALGVADIALRSLEPHASVGIQLVLNLAGLIVAFAMFATAAAYFAPRLGGPTVTWLESLKRYGLALLICGLCAAPVFALTWLVVWMIALYVPAIAFFIGLLVLPSWSKQLLLVYFALPAIAVVSRLFLYPSIRLLDPDNAHPLSTAWAMTRGHLWLKSFGIVLATVVISTLSASLVNGAFREAGVAQTITPEVLDIVFTVIIVRIYMQFTAELLVSTAAQTI